MQSTPEKAGYLFLSSQGAWSRQWLLVRGRLLYHYISPQAQDPIGLLKLRPCVIQEDPASPLCFCVTDATGAQQPWVLCATAVEEKQEWLLALRLNMGGEPAISVEEVGSCSMDGPPTPFASATPKQGSFSNGSRPQSPAQPLPGMQPFVPAPASPRGQVGMLPSFSSLPSVASIAPASQDLSMYQVQMQMQIQQQQALLMQQQQLAAMPQGHGGLGGLGGIAGSPAAMQQMQQMHMQQQQQQQQRTQYIAASAGALRSSVAPVPPATFWATVFGTQEQVQWSQFLGSFQAFLQLSYIPPEFQTAIFGVLNVVSEKTLKLRGIVSRPYFCLFINLFGPITDVGEKCFELYQSGFFHGELSSAESEAIITNAGKRPGSFLLRLRKGARHQLALAFVDKNGAIKHTLISIDPATTRYFLAAGTDTFRTIGHMLSAYANKFYIPLRSSTLQQSNSGNSSGSQSQGINSTGSGRLSSMSSTFEPWVQ